MTNWNRFSQTIHSFYLSLPLAVFQSFAREYKAWIQLMTLRWALGQFYSTKESILTPSISAALAILQRQLFLVKPTNVPRSSQLSRRPNIN